MHTTDVHTVPADARAVPCGRRAVLLFARTPLSEARAKHIDGLGFAGKLRLFNALTRRAIQTVSWSGFDLIVATDTSAPIFRDNAAHVIRQRGADFGQRLLNAVHDLFALGYDEVAIIGNDSPELSGGTIRESLTTKEQGTLRLCRAADGGVTLIALDRTIAGSLSNLFAQLRWETTFLCDDLREAARHAGIPVDVCDGGNDLDCIDDLVRLASSSAAPRDLRLLARILLSSISSRPDSTPYIRPHRRTLRVCRQKAPPFLPFHST